MFGFIGKPVSRVVIEANGYVSGTERRFNYDHGAPNNNYKARYYFDDDNVNATKATTQALLDTVNVPYNGKPLVNLPNYSDAALSYTIAGGVFTPIGSKPSGFINFRRFTYGSSAALSPATRKVRQEFDWNGVTKFVLNGINPSTDASNNIKGVVNLNMRQFPNLRSCWIQGAYISSLTIQFNNPRLESVGLVAIANLSSLSAKIPASVKYIFIEIIGTISSLSTLLQDAVGCEALYLSEPLSNNFALTGNITTQTISGTLDVSHMTNLKVFVIGFNNLMTNLVLPLTNTAWDYVHIQQLRPTASAAFNTAFLDSVLANANIRALIFHTNAVTYAKNFGNTEVSTSLLALFLYGNKITGNFIVTDPRPNMRDLRLGIASSEQNVIANIDLTGFSGSAISNLQLCGVQCENIQLPLTLNSLTNFQAWDNKFDIVTNSDLVSKINGYVNLLTLHLGDGGTIGQVSTNGIGANPDFSDLINLQQLYVNSCKITGSLILPDLSAYAAQPWLYLRQIVTRDNPGLLSFTNFAGHAKNIQTLNIYDCPDLDVDLSTVENLAFLTALNSGVIHCDLSGIVSTSGISSFNFSGSLKLMTVTFPTTTSTCKFNDNINLDDCPLLATLNNHDKINYGGSNKGFFASGCSLDITISLGANSFLPTNITLGNNAMSVANIDATINSMYTNRAKWSAGSKSLSIAGTNAAPTGIYQAPAGFILGSNDGTPASAKEQAYVLVNNYSWTITMN